MTRIQWLIVIAIAILLISLCWVEVMRGDDPTTANREALERDLRNLALRAQDFWHRPMLEGGGEGSFLGLTADAVGLRKLTSYGQNGDGWFSVMTAGDVNSVELKGVGIQVGTNGSPVEIHALVLADSMYMTYIN